tara:strand:- start:705 stop:884 length:180 start_codon:yes stop_codon:yes gene_type:complete
MTIVYTTITIFILLICLYFFTREKKEYASLTEKGRQELAALLIKEIEKNPNLLNDSDDD